MKHEYKNTNRKTHQSPYYVESKLAIFLLKKRMYNEMNIIN
jgi:hypothetical protein